LVDEVYLDAAFRRSGRTAALLGNEFIVTNSLTKVYGLSGVRCGWVLAEEDLIRRMWHLNDLFEVNPAHPAECLSVVGFRRMEMLTGRAKRFLAANSQTFRSFLASRRELAGTFPEEGLMAFVRLTRGSVDQLCELLLERYETSVAPGRFFEMPEYFRVGLGNEPPLFSEGVRRLARALDELP
jgi:aspartate/methionine/tyrosine aminotransferase